ncbi:Multiple c2 and transmembrane domain-containing protein [Thalictrum thalictroides]|uniref:Multiple c2 and transmembrane domain-containing protein n=1 Tax=Thalictrum thalictroides TaxID=46969 RepID=A0A7J6VQK1_THATH|nr:Multiple c2 and transmembrane domain-containing protein [Thalictrum thalictroides]
MVRREKKGFLILKEATDFLNHVMEDKPLISYFLPLLLIAWLVERWLLPFSYWVPLAFAVWVTTQYGNFQRQLLVEDLNKRWKQVTLYKSPITPLEQCEWLNKLLMEVWPNFISLKLSKRFSSIVEKRLKHRKPRIIESIELLEFSLGSRPPSLGLHGTQWSTSGDQRILSMGFEWDTNNVNILLLAKVAKPLLGTARIVINSLHIKGDLCLTPILDGQAVLYSFESPPEVRIGIAFGSGGSQTLPATELPGVSSWLNKLFSDTLVKTMVEPRRRCYSLPVVDLRKTAVGGKLSVTVVSAGNLVKGNLKNSSSGRQQNVLRNSSLNGYGDEYMQTFVEVELGELTRRTGARSGSNPKWEANYNMVLHEDNGIIKFHLYEWVPNNVKHDYITSCEIKVKYAADDSTTFWAVGPGSGVLAKRAESVGQEVDMVLPFEGINSGQLTVKLVLREWTFSDGSRSLNNPSYLISQQSIDGPSNTLQTGRKLKITIIEGRDLIRKDNFGKCDPYIKLQYGKALYRTRTILHDSNPVWNQMFEFDEIGGGEYLKIKCYCQDMFSDDMIGSARVNLEGLLEDSVKDIWVPLEKANTGELKLQIEAVKTDAYDGSRNANGGSGCGLIELSLIEARDLVAADFRGTSDPYVRVQYGNIKKRTKVIYKTLSPQWNQTLEFPDDGSPLLLFVKDHNSVLPTSSIGQCTVEYLRLPPNQMADKWIPLQGVTKGEIHIQITRKVPELPKKSCLNSTMPSLSKAQQISGQMRQMLTKFQTVVEDGDLDGMSLALSEMQRCEDVQEEYMMQLETEETLLINKISELGQEIYKSSPRSKKNHDN